MSPAPAQPPNEWVEIAVPSALERWDGTAFREALAPPGVSIHHLFGRSESEVWAACDDGLYLWNGSQWSHPLTEGPLHRTWGSPAGELWAVGPAGLHYWNGKTWTAVLNREAGSRLRVVGGSATTEAWIGGTGGLLQRYTGSAWRPLEVQGDVLSLVSPEPGCAWFALGDDADPESSTLLRWDGVSLRPSELPGGRIRQLWAAGVSDIWAVGTHGLIAQWDGRTWTRHRAAVSTELRSVWGSGPHDVWVAGDAGRVLHWDGASWSDRSRPERADLAAIWGLDSARVWLASRAYRVRRAPHLDA
jgi:hypothetical protein